MEPITKEKILKWVKRNPLYAPSMGLSLVLFYLIFTQDTSTEFHDTKLDRLKKDKKSIIYNLSQSEGLEDIVQEAQTMDERFSKTLLNPNESELAFLYFYNLETRTKVKLSTPVQEGLQDLRKQTFENDDDDDFSDDEDTKKPENTALRLITYQIEAKGEFINLLLFADLLENSRFIGKWTELSMERDSYSGFQDSFSYSDRDLTDEEITQKEYEVRKRLILRGRIQFLSTPNTV